ncbi:MAG: class I SAM-dependent methyltransferase [Acidimicrobiia bacterium]|nr:class I SAM-dependent methyltransferase [Acidimicrobiia bacterium]
MRVPPPSEAVERLGRQVQTLWARRSRGTARWCPMCGWSGARFVDYGWSERRRPDAQCPRCGSLERHRQAALVLGPALEEGPRVLHLAPEPAVVRWLRARAGTYRSGDLVPGRAMEVLDLTDLDVPSASVDLVYCSHLLEHIPDDRAAMAELARVLAPGGLAAVMVPIHPWPTDEDPTVTDPAVRRARFGLEDHVRYYGLDIVERLEAVGFAVEVHSSLDPGPEVVTRYGLAGDWPDYLFVCRLDSRLHRR